MRTARDKYSCTCFHLLILHALYFYILLFTCTYCKRWVDTLASASLTCSNCFTYIFFYSISTTFTFNITHTHNFLSLSLSCNDQLQCSIGCITSVVSATIYVYLVCCVCSMCAYYNLCSYEPWFHFVFFLWFQTRDRASISRFSSTTWINLLTTIRIYICLHSLIHFNVVSPLIVMFVFGSKSGRFSLSYI